MDPVIIAVVGVIVFGLMAFALVIYLGNMRQEQSAKTAAIAQATLSQNNAILLQSVKQDSFNSLFRQVEVLSALTDRYVEAGKITEAKLATTREELARALEQLALCAKESKASAENVAYLRERIAILEAEAKK